MKIFHCNLSNISKILVFVWRPVQCLSQCSKNVLGLQNPLILAATKYNRTFDLCANDGETFWNLKMTSERTKGRLPLCSF